MPNQYKNKVVYGNDTLIDITDTTAEATDVAAGAVFYAKSGARSVGTYTGAEKMDLVTSPTADNVLITDANGQAQDSGVSIDDVVLMGDMPLLATDSTLGLVKLNPNESVDVNANGQLTVGGRLGQFPGGGVYYPTTIEPTNVGSSSFLMTDGAKNLQVAGRDFAILAGANVTLKGSHAAGTTTYRVSNTYSNRFMLSAAIGGRMAIDQADATANGTAAILSVEYANGTAFTVHFGPNEADNDIIVTTDRSINPNAAITKARVYGVVSSSDVIAVGQGVSSPKGKAISLGQSTKTDANQAFAVGNSVHILANNSGGIGRFILIDKTGCFAAGEGHDFSNATNGTSAFGYWSVINANTKFAVGNGTANGANSNIFEVTDDSGQTGLVVKSLNGTRYKITVDDSGNLTASAM